MICIFFYFSNRIKRLFFFSAACAIPGFRQGRFIYGPGHVLVTWMSCDSETWWPENSGINPTQSQSPLRHAALTYRGLAAEKDRKIKLEEKFIKIKGAGGHWLCYARPKSRVISPCQWLLFDIVEFHRLWSLRYMGIGSTVTREQEKILQQFNPSKEAGILLLLLVLCIYSRLEKQVH